MKKAWWWIGVVALACAAEARAENRRALPLGGRTGSMGGAGVAFGDDAAMAFLNPSGLSRVPNHVLSLSLAAYSLDVYRYDLFFAQDQPPSFMGMFDIDGNELRSTTFNSIPSALSYVLHLGDEPRHALAFSVLLPHAERRELEGILRLSNSFFTANSGFSMVRTQRSYYFGPSYALALGDEGARFRLGASLFLVRTERTIAIETNDISGGVPAREFQVLRSSTFQTGSSYDLDVSLGAQLDFGVFSVGLAVHAPSLHVGGSFELTGRLTRFGNGVLATPDLIEERQVEGDFVDPQPLRLVAGLGLELDSLAIAADVGLIMPPQSYDRLDGRAAISTLTEAMDPINREEELVQNVKEDPVVHGALGLEYRVTKSLALRAGGFFELSTTNLDDLANTSIGTERMDRFGGTFGVGLDFGGAETSIAFQYVGGIGKVIGFDVGNFENTELLRDVEALQSSFSLLISGSVDLQSMLGS